MTIEELEQEIQTLKAEKNASVQDVILWKERASKFELRFNDRQSRLEALSDAFEQLMTKVIDRI